MCLVSIVGEVYAIVCFACPQIDRLALCDYSLTGQLGEAHVGSVTMWRDAVQDAAPSAPRMAPERQLHVLEVTIAD